MEEPYSRYKGRMEKKLRKSLQKNNAFQSEKQRRYLWANEPEIARDWTDTYGSGIAKASGGRIGYQEDLL